MDKLTREQAAIIGAFTGVTAGPFGDVQAYAERLIGEPISTYGMMAFADRIKEMAKADFLAICASDGDPA